MHRLRTAPTAAIRPQLIPQLFSDAEFPFVVSLHQSENLLWE